MSAWLGMHNHERHRIEASGMTSCRKCADTGCSQMCPCWCCLDAEVERLTAERQALRAGGAVAQAAAGKRIAELTTDFNVSAERVRELLAEKAAVLAVCEQQAKDRSLYSDDRHRHGLDYIDGWNDALDLVEQALRGDPQQLALALSILMPRLEQP